MQIALQETKYLIKKYNVQANKRLGQNFLVNDEIIDKIIDRADITNADLVIEIGPGMGILTNKILEKAGCLYAIELDENMIKILNDRFNKYNNFNLIEKDILKVDLKDIIEKEKELNKNIKNVKIVANLPYYISTPIITKLLEDRLNIDSIIVMVQKEVADRLTAETGTKLCGSITYFVDYYAKAIPVVEVAKESFIPNPKVESKVIKLEIRKNTKINVINEKLFFNIIKKAFMQRRKTLQNALINGNIIEDKETAEKILQNMKLDKNIRGECLNIEQFGELADYIEKISIKKEEKK